MCSHEKYVAYIYIYIYIYSFFVFVFSIADSWIDAILIVRILIQLFINVDTVVGLILQRLVENWSLLVENAKDRFGASLPSKLQEVLERSTFRMFQIDLLVVR